MENSTSEDEIIKILKKKNERLLDNFEELEKINKDRNEAFKELLKAYETKKKVNGRNLEMMRQRQALGEQKLREMEYLLQLLKMRARQIGIEVEDDDSESGSDDVFDESDSDGNEE